MRKEGMRSRSKKKKKCFHKSREMHKLSVCGKKHTDKSLHDSTKQADAMENT